MVLSSPSLAPALAARIDEPACNRPHAKATTLMYFGPTPNFEWNQVTISSCTTKPPAKASTANSEESLTTVPRERRRGRSGTDVPSGSTTGDSRRAIETQIAAPTGKTSSHLLSVG